MCADEFGFSRPAAVRQLADKVTAILVIFYPRRMPKRDPDNFLEIVLPFDKHSVDLLIKDPVMSQFFKFRDFEAGASSDINLNLLL